MPSQGSGGSASSPIDKAMKTTKVTKTLRPNTKEYESFCDFAFVALFPRNYFIAGRE